MVNIGDRRELFVDHLLIETLRNTQLIMHHPVRRERVLHFDRTWEGRHSNYLTVLEDNGQYRLYYRAGPDATHSGFFCLATSDDGIDWERPALGLHDFEGDRENNILFSHDQWSGFAPFIDTKPGTPPEQRYKAIVNDGSDQKPGTITLGAAVSADGIKWAPLQDEPIMTKGGFDSLNLAFWSESEGCYVAYFRVYSKSPDWRTFLGRRSIARATSDDFIHWSEPQMMDFGDTPTEELYTNGTTPYFRAPHLYVALASRYVLGRKTPLTKEQLEAFDISEGQRFISDTVFLASRGSNCYDRTFMEAFFRPGLDPANWSSRNNMAAWGILQTGPTEMSLYFDQHYAQATNHLLRATMRLDGFSSVNAGYHGGELLTRPFIFSGSQLELNMSTSGVGSIRVEVQDEQGKPFRDYGVDDSYDLYGDDIAKIARWHGSPDVSKLAGQPIRLRFVMKDADLYSIRFHDR